MYSQSDGQGLISCLFRFRSLGGYFLRISCTRLERFKHA
nr:MAG TPA: hypothetical protein [Caudoviricetes sp.]DAX11833.1 MAG TPA: hypothetical protein [Bacteriophage sp.]